MEKYDYLQAVIEDVRYYIKNEEIKASEYTREEFEELLDSECWDSDCVTGNASGSYYCNAWKAEEALCHNWDLLEEALQCFGDDSNPIEKGAEWCDVTIRCYMLHEAINYVIENDYSEEDFKKED